MDKHKKYEGLKGFLKGNLELDLTEDEINDVLDMAIRQDGYNANVGYKHERINHNAREKAFYETWLEENEPLSWINNGQGILQDLFIERKTFTSTWITEINNRDRMIAATVIQWLGTNCGMSFLQKTLKKFNAHIVEEKVN